MEGPCEVCKKPSGPCKIKAEEKSFFTIYLIELFQDHVIIPCYIREQFNKLCSTVVTLESTDGYLYTVEADVLDDVTVLRGSKWQELVSDHGLAVGDTMMFHFPKEYNYTFVFHASGKKRKNKPRIDSSVSALAFNSDIEYKLGRVVYSLGVSLSVEARGILRNLVINSGVGAGAIFVHRLSPTNINQSMKFPGPLNRGLRLPKRGDMLVYVSDLEVDTLLQYRVDSDGRLCTVGAPLWKEFVQQADLKRNQLICVMIFKESTRLVVCVGRL